MVIATAICIDELTGPACRRPRHYVRAAVGRERSIEEYLTSEDMT